MPKTITLFLSTSPYSYENTLTSVRLSTGTIIPHLNANYFGGQFPAPAALPVCGTAVRTA